ncbi:MAG: hypothetical protein JJV98_03270 [Desulfosarcina sp.]|nr:hypothetical protein [Desulfobacterales bacterium]
MNRRSGITTRYFRHYEALEDAFRRRIATLLPRKHAGTDRFWQDLHQLLQTGPDRRAGGLEHYITSNPRDCLAFGTPRQVLKAALMTTAPSAAALPWDGVAARFGLQSHLNQPVRSLSGGETVRVALAKAFIGAARADRLTIASPLSWLSLSNRRYFHDLADHCGELGQALEVFALEGEDSTQPAAGLTKPLTGPGFRLVFRKAGVVLTSLVDSLQSRRLRAAIDDAEFSLQSPCLIQGDNGQGKSLMVKALAGVVLREGHAGLETEGRRGHVRLLLQDLIDQTLMRSFKQMAVGIDAGAAVRVYDDIRTEMMAREVLDRDEVLPFDMRLAARAPASLLELKILLAAVRIATTPAAIVLDEPDWGLRRASAMAFVAGVIQAAHQRGVAVLIISHKPWWHPWAASFLHIRKARPAPAASAGDLFRIRMERTMAAG